MSKRLFGVLAGFLFLAGLAAPAMAQEMLHAQPASILIFPLYSSRDMENTLITVTNTNDSEIVCAGNPNLREGDIEAHFTYYDGGDCQESDLPEDLTPADTITVLARGHNPQFEKGYLVVEARDPESGLAVDYDFLIGSAIVVNSEFDFQWSYTPYAFEALITGGDQDNCGRFFTDLGDGSTDASNINFDGMEYSFFPDILLLDQFFGEGSAASRPNVTFSNTLFLMSTDPGDGIDNGIGTPMTLLGWNNNEQRFSRTFTFDCTFCAPLSDITNAVTQTNMANDDGDPDELLGVQSGWLRLRSTDLDDGVLGVFVQNTAIGAGAGGTSFVAGRELQYTGTREVALARNF